MHRSLIIAAVLLFAAWTNASAEAPQAVTVKGAGEGVPILFIPGLASPGAVWDDLAPVLGKDRQTHIAHFAGFAGAPPIEGPFFETRLSALKEYLAQENLYGVTVVGHSLGGVTAMKLALEEPDRISKIVIVDSVPFLAQFFLGAQNLDQARAGAAQMRAGILQLTDDQYKAQQQQFTLSQARDKNKQEKILSWSLSSDRPTVAAAMSEMLTMDLRPELEGIKAQILVTYPWRASAPFSAKQTDTAYRAQYANAKTATFKRIDDSAHFIMFDQPEELTNVIEAFIEK